MIDGHGDPKTTPHRRDTLQKLYPVACALKAVCQEELARSTTKGPTSRWGPSDESLSQEFLEWS